MAGYVPPVIDTEVCCSVCGYTFSPQLTRVMAISAVLGAALSFVVTSALYSICTSDLFAVLAGIALVLAAMVILHKSTTVTSAQNPTLILIFRVGAAASVVGAVMGLVIRFDRRTPPVSSPYSSSSVASSFSSFTNTVFICVLSSTITFVLCTFSCDLFNRLFSEEEGTANTTTFDGPATGNGSIGKELCARQVYAIVAATVLFGGVEGFFFGGVLDVEEHVNRIGFEQVLGIIFGLITGAGLGYVNHHAVGESLNVGFVPIP